MNIGQTVQPRLESRCSCLTLDRPTIENSKVICAYISSDFISILICKNFLYIYLFKYKTESSLSIRFHAKWWWHLVAKDGTAW